MKKPMDETKSDGAPLPNAPRTPNAVRSALLFSAGAMVAIGAIVLAQRAWVSREDSRSPASVDPIAAREAAAGVTGAIRVDPEKLARLRKGLVSAKHSIGKAHRLVSVAIRAEPASAAEEGVPVRLIAAVYARQASSRIDVTWTVPAQVDVAQGRLEDALIGMQAGEEREIELTVIPRTSENREIVVNVTDGGRDGRMLGSAAHHTVDQPRLDAELEQNAEIAKVRYGRDAVERIRE